MFGKRVTGNPWPLFEDNEEGARFRESEPAWSEPRAGGRRRERTPEPPPAGVREEAVRRPAGPPAGPERAGVRALPAPHRAPPARDRDAAPAGTPALALAPHMGVSLEEARRIMFEAMTEALDLDELDRLDPRRAREEIGDLVEELNASRGLGLPAEALKRLAGVLADDLIGLGPLEALISRADVEEIRVTAHDYIQVEVQGRLRRADLRFRDPAHFWAVCRRLAGQARQPLDAERPMCDARLPDGARLTIIIPPTAAAPVLRLRRPRPMAVTLDHLVGDGLLGPHIADILALAVRSRCSTLVVGPDASGARAARGGATLLNALIHEIDPRESLAIVEEVRRLSAPHADAVRLLAEGGVTAAARARRLEVVRAAAVLGADRLIIDPVTEAEAAETLHAMAGTHPGSLARLAAPDARAGLARLEAGAAAGVGDAQVARALIAGAVDLVIETRADGGVSGVSEVTGLEQDRLAVREVLAAGERNGGLRFIGDVRPSFWPRVRAAGLEDAFADALRAAR